MTDPPVYQWPGKHQDLGDAAAGAAVRQGATLLQAAIAGAIASFGDDETEYTEAEFALLLPLIPACARRAFVPPIRKRDNRKGHQR